jgi:two-component system sensor histidine kinase QseC
LRNLLDNAIRHAPNDGQVSVRVLLAADTLSLCVEDDGPGVIQDVLARLGQRFFRDTETLRAGDGGGSGLGLSIAQRVIRLHGGTLRFGRSALGGLAVYADWPAPR